MQKTFDGCYDSPESKRLIFAFLKQTYANICFVYELGNWFRELNEQDVDLYLNDTFS